MSTYTSTVQTTDIASEYNPFIPPQLDNPYPVYARARKEAPVFYSPMLNLWIVTRYDDVSHILKNPIHFSSAHNFDFSSPLPSAVLEVLSKGYPNIFTLVISDPPHHERLRGLLTQAFHSEKELRPCQKSRNWEIAHELVDTFVHDGQADLVHQFTLLFPLMMMSVMTGLPHQDMKTVLQTCDNITKLLWEQNSLEKQLEYAHSVVALQQYLTAQVEERRTVPRHDILTDLINARVHGETSLETSEIVNLITTILFAIYENIPKGLANTLMLLLRHPEQLHALQEDPNLTDNAIEEAIRVEPSIQGLLRTTKQAVEIGGVTIPAESRIQIMVGSANHDETHFPDPDRFDIYRENQQKHLAFGTGIHRCIGVPVTHALGRIAIQVLLERLPNLRIRPDQALEFEPNLIFRVLKRLPVEWDTPVVFS